jgi:dTDP-4-dehydrorhamnose reductase
MTQKRRVLIAGSNGQVGHELKDRCPADVELMAYGREELDITNRKAVLTFVERLKPDVVINAAAYTAVDKAESEVQAAFLVNRDGAAHMAEACQINDARLIHLSTDFVFDGKKSTPYLPEDAPNPLGIYGASKLAGEAAAAQMTEGNALIVRTAWVYSNYGHNFVKTMLRLFTERDEVRVVADQIGTPTHAGAFAETLWKFSSNPQAKGIYHWTDAGMASWYDFAVAIYDTAAKKATLRTKRITPISYQEYPLPAMRPMYSVLDKTRTISLFGQMDSWNDVLARHIAAIGDGS